MTDTPDVIDTLFPDTTTYEPTRTLYTAESIRKILDTAGYVLVKADGLNHGDQLEHKGWYGETPSYYGFRFVHESTTTIINRPMFVVRDDAARNPRRQR